MNERSFNSFVSFDDENKSKRSYLKSMEDVGDLGCCGWPKTAEKKVPWGFFYNSILTIDRSLRIEFGNFNYV